MKACRRLFSGKQIYDLSQTEDFFLEAIKETLFFHLENCADYRIILEHFRFSVQDIKGIEDISKIPMLPTLFLKSHSLFSMPYEKLFIKATTSGTSGQPVKMGLDFSSGITALPMVLRTFRYHKLLSAQPVNYIILGYEPTKRNQMGAVKTAFGATLLSPALHREYALKDNGTEYELDLEGVIQYARKCERSSFPLRLIGFPHYLYLLMQEMKERGICVQLHKNSKVLLGGGWKQFSTEAAPREVLYQLAEEVLGIREENCKEFFAAVEHPVLYCACKNHHYHIPIYSRVLIRDSKDLKPVQNGTPGLLNLITPVGRGMPYLSIMTDDIAVMHDSRECGCGISSDWFEILGRCSMEDIKTCAAASARYL